MGLGCWLVNKTGLPLAASFNLIFPREVGFLSKKGDKEPILGIDLQFEPLSSSHLSKKILK